tara:strand:+ start:3468 stop:3581 length:114 start_codon:yes stop_codon:yes gene_type:complete
MHPTLGLATKAIALIFDTKYSRIKGKYLLYNAFIHDE